MISQHHTLIPACDVTEKKYEELVKATADLPQIGAYKLGFVLALSIGLPKAVEIARKYTKKPLIYDHQKAGTDIPDTGKSFMKVCKQAGIDAVILFPQAGPNTEQAWIEAAQEENLEVIVGGCMTHKGFVSSEKGWIRDEAVFEIYKLAAKCKVKHYVVPSTRLELCKQIHELLKKEGVDPVFYSPGLVSQGADIANVLHTLKTDWHPIVGRALYEASNMRAEAEKLITQLKQAEAQL
ncbi:MAG: hypothetical protein COV43_02870 [Deltaproteobacteria bacterium CG11_big_fil_rev_8_21_14_0_20_42_23]|nr:MAG: hypothetical protein COV43_02870 [Deltaproteobacteria bacterium CG11_big_fil_rev_8_21_14_0_20_42_23]PJC63728.1 MAG: hypothetical protein CO021_07485 [Deltaproteobacteria bacterium CG_4_9_14_0_2_um_filter_42_21]